MGLGDEVGRERVDEIRERRESENGARQKRRIFRRTSSTGVECSGRSWDRIYMVLQTVSWTAFENMISTHFDFQHYAWVSLRPFTLGKTKAHMLHSGE